MISRNDLWNAIISVWLPFSKPTHTKLCQLFEANYSAVHMQKWRTHWLLTRSIVPFSCIESFLYFCPNIVLMRSSFQSFQDFFFTLMHLIAYFIFCVSGLWLNIKLHDLNSNKQGGNRQFIYHFTKYITNTVLFMVEVSCLYLE